MHIAYLKTKIAIYPAREAQIALLMAEKIILPAKYLDFIDIFSNELATVLLKLTKIIKHAIDLKPDKQLSYGLIYNLESVELEILKTFIKTNLGNNFIQLFKSSARAFILFLQKLDSSLCLCVDYQELKNLIIKN